MRTRRFLFLAVLLCTSLLVQAQIKLSFNPAVGETYSYRFISEQSIKQTINGNEIPVNVSTEMLMGMRVKENTGDEISVEYLYKEVVMDLSAPTMHMKYDSKNEVANVSDNEKLIAQFFSGLIGKSMIVILGKDGSVKSVSGFDVILAGIQKSINSDTPDVQQMKNMLSEMFNENAIKQTIEQSFKIYPDEEVKPGDSWNGDIALSMAGISNNMKNTYTLRSVEGDIAILDVSSVLNTKLSEIMEGELNGEQKGEVSLYIKTGMPVKSVLVQNTKGKFVIQGKELMLEVTSKATADLQN